MVNKQAKQPAAKAPAEQKPVNQRGKEWAGRAADWRTNPRAATPRAADSKSQYVETFSGKPLEGRPHISTLDWGTSRFSADLESGRRPELKSAEKRDVPLVIVEVFSIEVEIARRSSLPLLGF